MLGGEGRSALQARLAMFMHYLFDKPSDFGFGKNFSGAKILSCFASGGCLDQSLGNSGVKMTYPKLSWNYLEFGK